MASNFDMKNKDFREELICCVCQDHFKDPVTLMCGHSICRACLLGVFRAASNTGGNERQHCNVDCPGCRRTYQMTEQMIKKMSVNLTLRNIISALKGKNEPTLCETHNKHHFIFCFTCNLAKCLSCFLNVCAKDSHDTKEMDDIAKELRTQVRGMLDVQDSLVETAKRSYQGNASPISQASRALQRLLIPLESAEAAAMTSHVETIRSNGDRLRELLQSPDANLVASREEIAAIRPPNLDNSHLYRLHDACRNLTNDLSHRIQELQGVMKDIGVDPSVSVPSLPPNEVPSENTADSDSFESLSSHETHEDGSSTVSENDPTNAIFRVEYDTLFSHSISAAPYFAICTDNGCFYTNSGSSWFLYNYDVKAISIIPNTGKIVAIVDGVLEIHRVTDLAQQSDAVYVIPMPSMCKPCHFECLGVTTGEEKYYVVSDANNVCIHLWHSGQRGWCDVLDLTNYAMHANPSFKLCVYEELIYVTFYHQGMVMCFSLNGEMLWNSFTIIKPNGIVASDRGVFVCESGEGKCIQILNHDGSHRQALLSGYFQRPWDVAILDGTLAVLERSYRHHSRSAPTYVSLVQLDELFLGL